jgi:hypothetical protein
MAYTTITEVKKRALIKYETLNYDSGKPFATETDFDTWLSSTVIPEAERAINEFCRRPDFSEHADEIELFDGDGLHNFLVPNKRPVIAISKFEFKKGDGTWELKSTDVYYMHGDQLRYNSLLPYGFQNIRVTYDWGYATVPEDVSHVAAEIAARFLQKCSAFKMGPLIRVGDWRVQLANPEIFTPDLKEMLDHYRREAGTIA